MWLPSVTHAQLNYTPKTGRSAGALFDNTALFISNMVIGLLFGIAIVGFFAGVIGYVSAGDNSEKRAQMTQYIVRSLIGIFVMFSIWGLLAFLFNSLGIAPGGSLKLF